MRAFVLALSLAVLAPATFGQDEGSATATVEAAADEAPAAAETESATEPPVTDTPSADAATDAAESSSESTTDTAPGDGESSTEATTPEAPATTSAPTTGTAPAAFDMKPILLGALILGLFIVPTFVGGFLARALRMPDHAWKISLVLVALSASIAVVSLGDFKFGPDLAGGITLIYELAESQPDEEVDGDVADDTTASRSLKMNELIAILKRRIDPTGTKEVTIRQYGPAVEIIIPETGQDALQFVKRRITEMGQLEFRITADPRQPNAQERAIIEQAKQLPPGRKDVVIGGRKVAEWIPNGLEEFGPIDAEQDGRGIVKRLAGEVPEALVLIEPDSVSVTGDYLSSVSAGVDETGGPAVHFSFNPQGARRFQQLTSKNLPNRATGAERYLGIVLDKHLLTAPGIRETISTRGQISGRNMTLDEVEHVVSILKEGSLPLKLNKDPISEEIISPTLGAQTIESGKQAILWSLVAIFAFMLVYYRYAGFVACLALAFNLLLVLALMVMINAAFTLPGLAGLVLTLGMSVDANILIFERMREEFKSGAALRMVIRNGFDRAMSAIIDSNITTIIAGIALYVFATDQVKGFAVTLILGILTSMFTAIFFSRLIFDISERQGWLKEIRMMKLMSQPNFDFLGKRWPAIGASLVLIAIGMAAVVGRGQQLLDIDFTGGSSVTFVLKPDSPLSIAEVREMLEQSDLKSKNLLVVRRGETNTRYSVDTSEQSVEGVKQVIEETFAGKLLMYSVKIGERKPFDSTGVTGTEAAVTINEGPGFDDDDGVSRDALLELVQGALEGAGHAGVTPYVDSPAYQPGSGARLKEWVVRLPDLDQAAAEKVFSRLETDVEQMAMFPLANKIGGRVSRNMQLDAFKALGISLLGVVAYLWVRFQKLTYGLAAAAALVHDVLVTIGALAASAYIVTWVPGLANALKLDSFQIGLTIVAALLTIVGYSLNDTIVTFDRLREIKGKSPRLTPQMVNASVNQCLSRTILTALTVFITVAILYFWGGDGIHGFAFAFLIGTVAGTYSTIYIAAPVLLWLSGVSAESTAPATT
jgi:SecD/SecF fusion protein